MRLPDVVLVPALPAGAVPPAATVETEPPMLVETVPLTNTDWALMVTRLDAVVLPEARFTSAELTVSVLAEILPLLVSVPVALRVSVVDELPGATIAAPAATVRLPVTATVTFALASAFEIAVAVSALKVISVGSSIQNPTRPAGAATLIKADAATFNAATELVSM